MHCAGDKKVVVVGDYKKVVAQSVGTMRNISYPASSSQRRFWFLELNREDIPAYNLPRLLLIRGKLDVEVLTGAFRALLTRHDVLRTGLYERDGEILAEIQEDATVHLQVHDLGFLPAAERMAEALNLTREEGRKVFDLSRPPLLRLLLIRFTADEHLLLMVIHHVVTDGWSMSLIFDEIAELYRSGKAGERPNLAPLPLRYADFAHLQREHLTAVALADDIVYWRTTLRGCPVLLELPGDHARPAIQSNRGALQILSIPADLCARLKQACRRGQATLSSGLLALFQILLSRYSGTQDICVGTPVAGRSDPDLAQLVGCFVNTIVMRTDLSEDPCFLEVLRRVRDVVLGAYAHQDLPFQQLLTQLRPERDLGHSPLFSGHAHPATRSEASGPPGRI